jgi:hypothetical protein
MKYYLLEEAMRTEETGDQHPQILKMSKKQDFDDDNGVYVFARISLPQTNPDLRFLLLDKAAKITDVISTVMLSMTGLLISEKVKNLLNKYKLPEHRYYEAYVLDQVNNVEYKYYWLQMVVNYDLRYLDISKSSFVIATTSIIKTPPIPIEIASYEDYREKQSKMSSKQIIKVSRATLNSGCNEDIFKIPGLTNSWIISDVLKESLIKNKITGVTIRETENIIAP